MENFEGKHRAYDPVKHHDSRIETRLSEIKYRILRSAERKLLSYLRDKIYNIKIADSKISALEIKEDLESGEAIYSGKVDIITTFLQKNQIKKADFSVAIVESQPEIVAEEIQKAIENSSEIVTVAPDVLTENTTVQASLKNFKIVDDGSKYLKIYHAAAYGDLEPIGAISKDEYSQCTTKADLLKAVFQDEALAWPASVEFTDEFTEPTIVASTVEPPIYKVKAESEPKKVVPVTEDLTSKFKSADTFRFNLEAAQNNYNELQRRIEQRAVIALADSLKANRMGNFKIKKAETSYNSESKIGKVVVHTELLDGKDVKVIPFEIQINDTSMTLPTKEQIVSLLKETKIVESAESVPEIKMGTEQKETLAKETNSTKEASSNAPPMWGYQEILRIPKEYLPASLKEGDVIEADGLRYRLVSKSEGQLDKGRDSAPHWMFERVHDTSIEKGNQPIYRVDY